MPDVRWKQRLAQFRKALGALTEDRVLSETRALTNGEQRGVIQAFEFTHELAWNLLKDYLEEQGVSNIIGSKGATRLAFRNGLVEAGAGWMQMIEDRNRTSHTYNEELALEIVVKILTEYYPEFLKLELRFMGLESEA